MSTQFFDVRERMAIARLCEVIIPSEPGSPGACELGVDEFLDDFLAHAPGKVQALWKHGLGIFIDTCETRHAMPVETLDDASLHAFVRKGLDDRDDASGLHAFLATAKGLIVKAYYRTEHGLHVELKVAKVPRRAGNMEEAADAPTAMPKKTYDVIVVGSGATGSWAAKELVESGLDVLMLESGSLATQSPLAKSPYELRFRNMFDNDVLAGDRKPVQTRSWACDEYRGGWFIDDQDHPYEGADTYTWIRGARVGGRMNMWGRQVYRYSARDFSAEFHDDDAQPWPFTYEDIAPYYSEVESVIGVSGAHDGIATLPDGDFLPPMEMTEGERHLKAAVEARWPTRRTIIGRTAILTVDHRGRKACRSAGHCYRGCDTQSFFDPVGSLIGNMALHDNFHLLPNAKVSHLLREAGRDRAQGVAFVDTTTGERHHVFAKAVVLAASTIASTRILLASRSQARTDGIGTNSGVLGKFLHGHVHSVTCSGRVPWLRKPVGIHDEGRSNQIYIPQFQNLDGDRSQRRFHGGFGIEGAVKHYMYPRDLTTRPHIGVALKESVRKDENPAHFFLTAFGTMQARAENQVSLGDEVDAWGDRVARISCAYGDNDLAMVASMKAALSEIATEAGFEVDFITQGAGMPGLCVHEVGSARMGRNPCTSVLDPFNRVWDMPNVLVVDGACFPSSGPQNPTLTMMAIALRASRQLVKDLARQTSAARDALAEEALADA